MKLRHLLLGRKAMTNLDKVLKSKDITLPKKVLIVKAMFIPVVMNGCEYWTIKKAEHRKIDAFELWVLEKTFESPWDCKEIKPVDSNGNQPWLFIGRTFAEAEAPLLWPLNVKSWLTGKDPDAGQDWGQEEKRTEDEMVGWHHQLNRHESEQTLGDTGGEKSLECYSPWGHKTRTQLSDWTTITTILGWPKILFRFGKSRMNFVGNPTQSALKLVLCS